MINASIYEHNGEYYSSKCIEIYPTKSQKEKLFRNIDLSRFVYNWGIELQEKTFMNHKVESSIPSRITLFQFQSLFSKERKTNKELSFLKDISVGSARIALAHVYDAYERFFDESLPNGHPRYKTRKRSKKSFGVRYETSGIIDGRLKIEGIGRGETIDVGCHKYDNFGYKYDCTPLETPWINPTITFKNNRFYLSFTYRIEPEFYDKDDATEPIGIDLGVRQTMVLSTGEVFQQPDTSKEDKKIRRLNKQISRDYKRRLEQSRKTKTKLRDIPKSKNELKREALLNRYYTDQHNKKMNFYHNTTKMIVDRNPKAICIETIGVKKMRKMHPYSKKYIAQVSFYTIRRLFEYKTERRGVRLIEANPTFPSSQICSFCGCIHKSLNGKRIFVCPRCGLMVDRDFNASLNLRNLYYELD